MVPTVLRKAGPKLAAPPRIFSDVTDFFATSRKKMRRRRLDGVGKWSDVARIEHRCDVGIGGPAGKNEFFQLEFVGDERFSGEPAHELVRAGHVAGHGSDLRGLTQDNALVRIGG